MNTNLNLNRVLTISMAIAVTGLAVALAAASAWGRASGLHQKFLLSGISMAVVVSVHLAPALLRSIPPLVIWPFWCMCLVGAIYMHANFMIVAASDAALVRLASSPVAVARAEQRAAVEEALSSIRARPAGQIARQLSWTTHPARIAALEVELQEAQRADSLRAQLVTLAAGAAAAAAGATADPVAERLAGLVGVTANSMGLAASVLFAGLLEVLGMMLWFVSLADRKRLVADAEILPTQAAPIVQQVVQVNVQPPEQPSLNDVVHADAHEPAQVASDDLSLLRAAIERGECQSTLNSIRTFMRCGQSRASELRRALNVK